MKASDSSFARCGWIFNTEAGSGELCSWELGPFILATDQMRNKRNNW